MSRVLVLASTFPRWSGDTQPRFVLDLCKELSQDHEIIVLSPHCAGAQIDETLEGIRVLRFRYAPERFESLTYGGGMTSQIRSNRLRALLLPFFFASMLFRTIKLFRHAEIDVIHAHWAIPQGVVAVLSRYLCRASVKILTTCHGADLHALQSSPWVALKRCVFRKSDAISVVSRAMEKKALEIDASVSYKLKIIPMGVDLKKVFVRRSDFDLRDRQKLVFVGRLVEKKGLSYLLDALPAIKMRYPEVSLSIAGDGPLRASIEDKISSLGLDKSVELLGSVLQSELPDLYSTAAAAVFPFIVASDGDQEGLGLVVVEAQGCECPIVATSLPSLQDTMLDEQRKWLASPADAGSLAKAIIELLDQDESITRSAARTARVKALNRFDWSVIGQSYSDLIEGLAVNRRIDYNA